MKGALLSIGWAGGSAAILGHLKGRRGRDRRDPCGTHRALIDLAMMETIRRDLMHLSAVRDTRAWRPPRPAGAPGGAEGGRDPEAGESVRNLGPAAGFPTLEAHGGGHARPGR